MKDTIDGIQGDLEHVRPGSDPSGVAVTGRLLRLARHIEQQREMQLRSLGLTPADYDVLATLRRREGQTGVNPRNLQRALLVTSGGMTKRLDRLESAGLLERRPDPTDRRGVLIRLSRKGRSCIDRALDVMLETERRVVADAIPKTADRDRLIVLLRRLLHHLEEPEADARPGH